METHHILELGKLGYFFKAVKADVARRLNEIGEFFDFDEKLYNKIAVGYFKRNLESALFHDIDKYSIKAETKLDSSTLCYVTTNIYFKLKDDERTFALDVSYYFKTTDNASYARNELTIKQVYEDYTKEDADNFHKKLIAVSNACNLTFTKDELVNHLKHYICNKLLINKRDFEDFGFNIITDVHREDNAPFEDYMLELIPKIGEVKLPSSYVSSIYIKTERELFA
ncbi:MAG: hypothetical protein KatS3mg083_278 [Candidatus Dojkabacteria bacterium]|nr:MAG: hypothetical protein KatS3mg083_278 [Candidatus Dojkabacteria bacterium]